MEGEEPLATSGGASERLEWQLLWKAWLSNEPVLRRTCNGQDMVTAYKKVLDGDMVEAAKFRRDGCRPPRALVYNFLGLFKSERASSAALWQSKEEFALMVLCKTKAHTEKELMPCEEQMIKDVFVKKYAGEIDVCLEPVRFPKFKDCIFRSVNSMDPGDMQALGVFHFDLCRV